LFGTGQLLYGRFVPGGALMALAVLALARIIVNLRPARRS